MKLIQLQKIFSIQYGNSFDLNMLKVCDEKNPNKVNYVSRTRENNGVSAYVKIRDDVVPFETGLITVAGSGNSVLESFIQYNPFYTGYHVFILNPKKAMSDIEKLFYCYCIKQNQYKYSFGRQANKTLKDLHVPVLENISEMDDGLYIKNALVLGRVPLLHRRSVRGLRAQSPRAGERTARRATSRTSVSTPRSTRSCSTT